MYIHWQCVLCIMCVINKSQVEVKRSVLTSIRVSCSVKVISLENARVGLNVHSTTVHALKYRPRLVRRS